jgi:hypothetical protein
MVPEPAKSKPPKSTEEELHDLLPGLVSNRGWWRLSIAARATVAVPWIIFVCHMMDTRGAPNTGDGIVTLLGLTAASFFLPWVIVQLIGWVVEGFKQK